MKSVDRTLSFSKRVSSLKAKFFPRLKAFCYISASSWGPSKESLSLLYKAFLRHLLSCASPGWFPFLRVTNIAKLEGFHQEASCAIFDCLSSPSIPLIFSEASLPPLRVTLTHFTLSFYKRALRLSTSFSISGLSRLGVKPRLCRSSCRTFTSTHSLMLPSTSPWEALLAFLLGTFLPSLWIPLFLLHALALIPLFLAKVRLLPILTLSPSHDLVPWRDGSVPFLFGKGGFDVFSNCSLCGTETAFLFLAGPVCSRFFAEAFAILHALCWSRQHQQVCHFSSSAI